MLKKEIAARLEKFRESLRRKKLGAALVTAKMNVHYLSGFRGDDSLLLVSAGKKQFLITDSRFDEEADISAPLFTKVLRKGSLLDETATMLNRLRVKRAGFEADSFPVGHLKELRKKVKRTQLASVGKIISDLRRIKSAFEIEESKKAVRIAERAFIKLKDHITPGVTEKELAIELEYILKKTRADSPAFPSIVAFDSHAALPHYIPGERKLKDRSAVLIDWGARLNFYNSDLTRVLLPDIIPPKLRRIYDIVKEAQQRALAVVAHGASIRDVDAAARDCIKQEGFGRQFGHGLGHGIGIEVHEAPLVNFRNTGTLAAGEVITIEPGIYLRNVGGVRIEDDVLVTREGCEVLSTLPR